MDIARLLKELDDVAAFMPEAVSRQHLVSLCKQASAAIRQLQGEAAQSHLNAHATFLLQLGGGIVELGRRMQGHA